MWASYPVSVQRSLDRACKTLNVVVEGPRSRDTHLVAARLPTLCCEAMGGDEVAARLPQEAWALLYDASRLMDAVQDGHVDEGDTASQALSTATALFFEASSRLGQLPVHVQTVVYDHMREVVIGQSEDSVIAHPTLPEALSLAEKKTGAFIGLGCWLGAQSAAVDPERAQALGTYGRAVGTMLQIHDDMGWLESLGTQVPPGRERLSNVCLAWSWESMTPSERTEFAKVLQAIESGEDLAVARVVREKLIERGVRLFCAGQAALLWARARAALKHGCPEDSEPRRSLEALPDQLMTAFRLPV